MDLDAAAAELYGISPEEFIARRTALVGDARKAGDRTLANEIGQLRKPTRTAWLANLLARSEADRIDELLDLGRQLQEAQRSSSATDLRRLSARRRTTVDALTREAAELGKAKGYAASEGAIQEVSQTLQAALADPEVAEQLRRGRLVQAASYGGFGPVVNQPPTGGRRGAEAGRDRSPDLLAALAASVGTAGKRTTPPAAQDRARQQALQELAEAKDGWEAAGRAADEAAADAERASTRAEDLAAEIEKIRGRLREAESAERDARTEARAARKRAMQLRQSAAAAEQRVSTARTALKTLEG